MTAKHTAKIDINKKLKAVGYNPKFIEALLPDWWDDAITETPAGLQEASLIIGRLFSIRPETLWTHDAKPALLRPDGVKFKQRTNNKSHDLGIACALALSAARLVLRSFRYEYRSEPMLDSAELRKSLLAQGKRRVSFDDLLDHCLQVGIPVILLQNFPAKARKMEGVAFECAGRPCIVLTKKKSHGYLLFDLAHELGHITLGHTQGGQWVIDDEIDAEDDDEREQAANRFAMELITGNPDLRIVPRGKHLYPNQLARAARDYGEAHSVDPLHIVLNYAYNNRNHWPTAEAAIKLIATGKDSDQVILKEKLIKSLDPSTLTEDDSRALQHLMG